MGKERPKPKALPKKAKSKSVTDRKAVDEVNMATKNPERKLTLPNSGKSDLDDTDNLYLAFLSTPMMQDWEALCEALRAAKKAGKKSAELPLDFLLAVSDDILHVPMVFSDVIEEWNRVCDQEGMPQEKKNVPGPEEPSRPGDET
jgi:hypothetical protein